MTEHPVLSDGVPPLTARQRTRLDAWLEEVNARSEVPHNPHDLAWIVRDEIRAGRGHDVTAVAICPDYMHSLTMNPYGNGPTAWGELTIIHSGDDEECRCEPCTAERDDDE